MPSWVRVLVAGVIFLCLLAAPSWLVLRSSQFQYCINNHQEQQQGASISENNNPPSFPVSGTYTGCLGQFANTNGNGITAFSTLLLMVITAGLVVVGYMQIRTSRRQLRAYIFTEATFIVDGGTFPHVPAPVSTGCPNYVVTIKNFGQTPAYEVRHRNQITIGPNGYEKHLKFPDQDEKTIPFTTIGPQGITTSTHNLGRALTAFEIQSLATNGQTLIVNGDVTYKDVFGVRRKTTYMLGYAGNYPPQLNSGNLIFALTGNSAT